MIGLLLLLLPVLKQRVDILLKGFFHLDERWPGAFEVSAVEFLRRVNAEFAAEDDFLCEVLAAIPADAYS